MMLRNVKDVSISLHQQNRIIIIVMFPFTKDMKQHLKGPELLLGIIKMNY